jgi:hypothetical protein
MCSVVHALSEKCNLWKRCANENWWRIVRHFKSLPPASRSAVSTSPVCEAHIVMQAMFWVCHCIIRFRGSVFTKVGVEVSGWKVFLFLRILYARWRSLVNTIRLHWRAVDTILPARSHLNCVNSCSLRNVNANSYVFHTYFKIMLTGWKKIKQVKVAVSS